MLGRRVLAAAAVAAALFPSTATAEDPRPCRRIVFDPYTFYTPAGPVTVPIPYCAYP